jgi:hypothetical protein
VDVTKDSLLRTADTLLREGRRARRLSCGTVSDADCTQPLEDTEQLETRAARLQRDATPARNGIFVGPGQSAG